MPLLEVGRAQDSGTGVLLKGALLLATIRFTSVVMTRELFLRGMKKTFCSNEMQIYVTTSGILSFFHYLLF